MKATNKPASFPSQTQLASVKIQTISHAGGGEGELLL